MAVVLVRVQINVHAAVAGGTGILLDGEVSPASERPEAVPCRTLLVPVRPPERHVRASFPFAAKDLGPTVLVGVDTSHLTAEDPLGGVGKFSEEPLVCFIVIKPELLPSFNIEPELTELDALLLNVGLKSSNLLSCIAASNAREEIKIDVFETSSPSTLHAVGTGGVDLSDAPVAPDDGEIDVMIYSSNLITARV